MQITHILTTFLEENVSLGHFVYSKSDLKSILGDLTDENLNMILSRCVSKGVLKRICKGVYLFSKGEADSSIVIYKTASKLRDGFINYISLETVLSEESVISQQLPGWVTIMTTGRSGIINCGNFGTIEFVHTAKDISKIEPNLYLDSKSKMLKANVEQAYKDMIFAKRKSVDLIDFSEFENWRKEHECI